MMIELITFLFLNIIIHFTAYQHSRISTIVACRGQISSQATLKIASDAYESDNKLRSKVEQEVMSMRNTSTSSLIEEFKRAGLSTASLKDRYSLEKYLAIFRVHSFLITKQRTEYEKRLNRWNDYKVLLELKDIRSMSMRDLVNEIRQRGIDIDLTGTEGTRESMELALANDRAAKRINSIPTNFSSENGLGHYTAFLWERLFGNEPTVAPVVNSIQEGFKAARERVSDSFQTEAEREAVKRLIVNRLIEKKKKQQTANSSQPNNNAPMAKSTNYEEVVNESDLDSIIVSLRQMSDFDAIKTWANQQPRDLLSRILSKLDIPVPQYAARSTIAATLADAVMTEKTLAMVEQSETSYPSVLLVDTEDLLSTNSQLSILNDSSLPSLNSSSFSSSAIVGVASSSQRSSSLSQFDSFAVERDLVNGIIQKAQYISRGALSWIDMTILRKIRFEDEGQQLGAETTSSVQVSRRATTANPALRFIWSLNRTVIKQLLVVATWVGGSLLPSGHVLLLSGLYAVLSKKGVFSFLAAMLFIKSLSVVYDR
jgi:hypothetical protein